MRSFDSSSWLVTLFWLEYSSAGKGFPEPGRDGGRRIGPSSRPAVPGREGISGCEKDALRAVAGRGGFSRRGIRTAAKSLLAAAAA